MLKNFLGLACVLTVCGVLPHMASAKEECPPAAEVAEMQNPNKYQDCDYSNEGLNGMLHRAFAKKNDASEPSEGKSDTKKSESTKEELGAEHKSKTMVANKGVVSNWVGSFRDASELALLRAELIVSAAKGCNGDVDLTVERYTKQADGKTQLTLTTVCNVKP